VARFRVKAANREAQEDIANRPALGRPGARKAVKPESNGRERN
jgi:hypothetical protein